MPADRACRHCRRPIAPGRRADAVYCGRACYQAAYLARLRARRAARRLRLAPPACLDCGTPLDLRCRSGPVPGRCHACYGRWHYRLTLQRRRDRA